MNTRPHICLPKLPVLAGEPAACSGKYLHTELMNCLQIFAVNASDQRRFFGLKLSINTSDSEGDAHSEAD